MQKCIFYFLLATLLGFVFLTVGCGGSGTGADINTNTPVPTSPVATATPSQVTSTINGSVYHKDKTTIYNDPNLVVLVQSNLLIASGVQTNYSTLVHVDVSGHFIATGVPQGDIYLYLWTDINSYNNNKNGFIGSKKFSVNTPTVEISLVDGEFIAGNPTPIPTPTSVPPTVVPTPSGSPSPTQIPTPLNGYAGLVVTVTDDSGAVYNAAEIKVEDVTDVKYQTAFNPGDWHRIYNPVIPVTILTGKQKLDLQPGRIFNVLVFLSGQEMGSRVVNTVAGQTEAITIKIHSGSLYDVFVLFDFKNTFTTGKYDSGGSEVIDPNVVFLPILKITGDSSNYSKIVPLAHHDNISKWWQSAQKLYGGCNYSVSEMKIKRSGATMSGTPAGNFTVSGTMNLHLQENGPVLSGNFQTYLPGQSGIDHSYGTVTTGSGITYLDCPVFTDTSEKIPWGQSISLGHEGFIVSDFAVKNMGSDNSSAGYLITSESKLPVGIMSIWTNFYYNKTFFPTDVQKELITYQYTDGVNSLRLYSKLFKSNNSVKYFSLTAGQADAINISTTTEPYAPK